MAAVSTVGRTAPSPRHLPHFDPSVPADLATIFGTQLDGTGERRHQQALVEARRIGTRSSREELLKYIDNLIPPVQGPASRAVPG